MSSNSFLPQNTHSFHSFVRYNNEISLARAKAKHAETIAAKKKSKKSKKTKKKIQDPVDPSLHGEDVTKRHEELSSSSSESEVDKTPLGVMLAEPRPPKDDPDK